MNAHNPRSLTPPGAAAPAHVSHAKWAKPVPKPKKNFIPAQSWLAYSWIDRDPEMDLVHAAIAESGMTLEQIEEETIKLGHRVSKFTLMSWVFGDTRRPQNVTLTMVMLACGYDKHWIRR
jgi:hypothetical protein